MTQASNHISEFNLNKHGNKSQLMALVYRPNKLIVLDGRGTGKTTGVGVNRMYEMIHLMPGAAIVLGCDSYEHLDKVLVPAYLSGLTKLGLKEGENFWIDTFPPDDIPRPIEFISHPKGFIFFDNGTVIVKVSTNFNSHMVGMSVQAIFWEEGKYLKWESVKNTNLTKRGLSEFFGDLWCWNSLTVLTDMSDDPNNWTFGYYKEQNQLLLKIIASYQYLQSQLEIKLETTKNEAKKITLKSEIDRLEKVLNSYRRNATLVIANSSIQNLHMLGYDVIEEFLSLPAKDVMLNVLSIPPTTSNKYYYELLSAEKHGFLAKDFDFLQQQLDLNQPIDCRVDTGDDKDREMEVSMDWNNNIISLAAGQLFRKRLRLLQEFWYYNKNHEVQVKGIDPIVECINKFCHYNRFRAVRKVKLWYDHTADCLDASHRDKYWERAEKAFKDNGWEFIKEKYPQTTHDERYKIYKRILSGDETAPFQLEYEVENMTNWKLATSTIKVVYRQKEKLDPKSKVKIRFQIIEKDKSSENDKKPKIGANSIPLEQQSHITEAADGLVVGNWNKLNKKKTSGFQIRS